MSQGVLGHCILDLGLPGLQATSRLVLRPRHQLNQLNRARCSSGPKPRHPLTRGLKMHPHWAGLVSPAGLRDEARGSPWHNPVWFPRPLELMGHRIRDGGSEAESPPMDGKPEDQRDNKTQPGITAGCLASLKERKKEGGANIY